MKILKIYFFNLHNYRLIKIFSLIINFLFIGQLLAKFTKEFWNTPKKRNRFKHFNANSSYQSYWYAARIENLIKYKKNFYSDFIGHKRYKLGNFWHYNIAGIKFFFNNGCLSIICCYFFFIISLFFVTFHVHDLIIALILVFILSFNNEFIYNLFQRQNYNIFGLILVPFLYISILFDISFLSYTIFFLISYFSFTFAVINSITLLSIYLFNLDIEYLIMISFPLVIYLLNIFNLNRGNFINSIFYNMEAVGLKKNKKYTFKIYPKFSDYFFIFLNILFLISSVYSGTEYKFLIFAFVIALGAYFFNQVIRKFSDLQTVRGQIFMIASVILIFDFNDLNWIFYLISFSQIDLDYLNTLRFKNFYNFEKKVINFVSKVPKNNTVLIVCKKNNGNFPTAFGNMRHYIDPFIYFFSKKKVLAIPDWNTVFSNYNEKFLWGNSKKDIFINLKKNKTKYFLIESKNNKLPKYLSPLKYKVISFFNFKDKVNIITPKPYDNVNLLLIKAK